MPPKDNTQASSMQVNSFQVYEQLGLTEEEHKRLKIDPNHRDEVQEDHQDPSDRRVIISNAHSLDVAHAQYEVTRVKHAVQCAHRAAGEGKDPDGRAQIFEEGKVNCVGKGSIEDFFAPSKYYMDFFDVDKLENPCSRMHFHTGTRFVTINTGAYTHLHISSNSPFRFDLPNIPGIEQPDLKYEVDTKGGKDVYTCIVPPNSQIDVQIPVEMSHQFNAHGPNAVIKSVHTEELIETDREGMIAPNMMAQTIFCNKYRETNCGVFNKDIEKVGLGEYQDLAMMCNQILLNKLMDDDSTLPGFKEQFPGSSINVEKLSEICEKFFSPEAGILMDEFDAVYGEGRAKIRGEDGIGAPMLKDKRAGVSAQPQVKNDKEGGGGRSAILASALLSLGGKGGSPVIGGKEGPPVNVLQVGRG